MRASKPYPRAHGHLPAWGGPILLLGLVAVGTAPARARTVSTILDATGDGSGPRAILDPGGLAVDAAGTLYVASPPYDLVVRRTAAGAIDVVLDASGDGTHPLDAPTDVAVDAAGNLFVTSLNTSRVFRFAPGGTVTTIIDATGDGAGHPLTEPTRLAVDSAGSVFVKGARDLFRVSPGGTVTHVHEATSSTHRLVDVAVEPSGTAYVSEADGDRFPRVFEVEPDGTTTQILDLNGDDGSWHDFSAPYIDGLAVDAAGNVYAAGGTKVFQVAADGTVTELVSGLARGGVEVDAAGTLYFVGDDSVWKRTPDGILSTILTSSGAAPGMTFRRGSDLEVTATGTVYATGQQTDNVMRVDPDGTITELMHRNWDTSAHPLERPTGIALDGAGNRYVTGTGSANVFRVAPDGTPTVILDVTGDGAGHVLRAPTDVAVDAAGNVFVLDSPTRNVFRIAPGGTVATLLDAADGIRPGDIAVGPGGDLYAASCADDTVLRIDPSGAIAVAIDATGDGAGGTLDCPRDVAVDGSGNVWVPTLFSRRVFRIAPDGAVSVAVEDLLIGSVVVGPIGTLFAVGYESVLGLGPDGSVTPIGDGFDGIGALAADAAGNISLRDVEGIHHLTLTGDAALLHATPTTNPNPPPAGLVVDPAGDVFATSYRDDEVLAVTFDCPAVPRADCRRVMSASRGNISLKDKTTGEKDALRWIWARGAATSLADLGDPLTTDAYRLCLYDESHPVPVRLLDATVPPGGTCGARPCWKALGTRGFKYADRTAATGIKTLLLKAGTEGKATIKLNGKGLGLVLPTTPLGIPLRLQLSTDAGACWESRVVADGVIRNEPRLFKAKAE